MITDNRTKDQIWSQDTFNKAYDSFSYDMVDTLSATLDETFMHNPTPALSRLIKGKFYDDGDKISSGDASSKYGLDGALTFDAPVHILECFKC